ncbi:MAG TPA: hypothetical protein VKA79_13645, partial [Aestuariivirgaceae bacterium]|nr:hypothetical protein [Aestuariivirgaceae bacterium]
MAGSQNAITTALRRHLQLKARILRGRARAAVDDLPGSGRALPLMIRHCSAEGGAHGYEKKLLSG